MISSQSILPPTRARERAATHPPHPVEHLLLLLLDTGDRYEDDLLARLEPLDDLGVIPIIDSYGDSAQNRSFGSLNEDNTWADLLTCARLGTHQHRKLGKASCKAQT